MGANDNLEAAGPVIPRAVWALVFSEGLVMVCSPRPAPTCGGKVVTTGEMLSYHATTLVPR